MGTGHLGSHSAMILFNLNFNPWQAKCCCERGASSPGSRPLKFRNQKGPCKAPFPNPGSPSRTRTYNLVVNPAIGGTLTIELFQEPSDPPRFDCFFEFHSSASIKTLLRPNESPRSFESFCGLGHSISRIIVLAQSTFRIT